MSYKLWKQESAYILFVMTGIFTTKFNLKNKY